MDDRTSAAAADVESTFRERAGATPGLTEAAVERGRERVSGLLEDPLTAPSGLATLAGSAMSALWLDSGWTTEEARELITKLEEASGVPRALIGMEALGNPDLLALPLTALATIEVEALLAFGELDHASLWVLGDEGPACLVQRGRRRSEVGSRGVKTVVSRWQRDHAILLAEGSGPLTVEPLLIQAAAMLSPAFERASLVERNVSGREALAQSAERRLRRLGFDLHDGPVQDVLAMGAEITRLSEQLGELELSPRARQLLDGRMEDLRAYLSTIEVDLREFCSSLESPVLVSRPFEDALRGAVWTFTAKSDVQPTVDVEGDVDDLTDTQRITLYRIVQEALSNICDHSRAAEVSVELRILRSHIALEVCDDGVGFDVERALGQASRDGHIGLLGMMERVRLIGGDLQIESRPGGPTKLSARLAHYQPDVAAIA